MAKTVRIPLPEPIMGHDGPIKEIVLREPNYDDYVECGGEPYTIGQSEDDVLFTIEQPKVIWAYAKVCMVSPKDQLQLADLSFHSAREVRKAILGFFQVPAAASEPLAT